MGDRTSFRGTGGSASNPGCEYSSKAPFAFRQVRVRQDGLSLTTTTRKHAASTRLVDIITKMSVMKGLREDRLHVCARCCR